MIQAGTKGEVRDWVRDARAAGERTALVPTMGYLHEGHLSLIRLAREGADRVAVSIFVNPLQFGPNEDLARYPRDLDRDLELAREAGAELVFTPTVEEMYPGGEPWVAVVPERGADRLCGASRPGHFRGVLTVVAKLFGIFTPDVAYFGQKDFQQLTLIRRMVAELDMPLQVRAGPTVREPDGLAMSSRNVYLTPDERSHALALRGALAKAEEAFAAGEKDPAVYREILLAADGPMLALEYGEVVDPETLEPATEVRAGTVCAIAGRVGKTRLIDNTILGA
jgi:pantoate--beta-alanine ligase